MVIVVLTLALATCGVPSEFPEIDRRPVPTQWMPESFERYRIMDLGVNPGSDVQVTTSEGYLPRVSFFSPGYAFGGKVRPVLAGEPS